MNLVRASWCHFAVLAIALVVAGCDSPNNPDPINPPPTPTPTPPTNIAPTIESISVQGRSANQPSNFADVGETVDVIAAVRDAETAVEQLQYNWTASVGTFSGTGPRVAWQAPADVQAAVAVTLTLEVVERYGANLEHKVTSTATVALHNSLKEVGDMARQFLIDFSTTSLKDWRIVMRNFKESACPPSNEYADEQRDVENHYTNFVMHNYRVDAANVTRNFGGSCYGALFPPGIRGDACVSVPVMWDSTDLRNNSRRTTTGTDYMTAAFSKADDRWWLCASRFRDSNAFGHPFYSRSH